MFQNWSEPVIIRLFASTTLFAIPIQLQASAYGSNAKSGLSTTFNHFRKTRLS
jgi:hypothetical protein